MSHNRRRQPRRSTRLRPGKLITEGGRFLCDCALVESSAGGVRIRAFAPVETLIPENLFLFDEVESVKQRVRVVWARGAELGLLISSGRIDVASPERHRIAGRFYAVAA